MGSITKDMMSTVLEYVAHCMVTWSSEYRMSDEVVAMVVKVTHVVRGKYSTWSGLVITYRHCGHCGQHYLTIG